MTASRPPADGDESRTPLLLLPGLLNDADLWRDQIAALSDVARCEVADITRDTTIEAATSRVLAEAPPRFALAGFSLGGYVAQEMLRQEPKRITRLALLDTGIHADAPDRAAARRALNKAARAPGRFHGFGEKLFASYLHPDHFGDEAIVSRIRGMTERLGPEVFVRQNNLVRKEGAEVIRDLRVPLLVLCGENDVLTPPAGHREIAALAPQARLAIVPRSGHMSPIEQPRAVADALRDWLLDAPSAPM